MIAAFTVFKMLTYCGNPCFELVWTCIPYHFIHKAILTLSKSALMSDCLGYFLSRIFAIWTWIFLHWLLRCWRFMSCERCAWTFYYCTPHCFLKTVNAAIHEYITTIIYIITYINLYGLIQIQSINQLNSYWLDSIPVSLFI